MNRGIVYFELGNIEEAIGELYEALISTVENDKASSRSLNMCGKILFKAISITERNGLFDECQRFWMRQVK